MNINTIIIAKNKQTSTQLEHWMSQQTPALQLIGKANNTQEGLMMLQQKQAKKIALVFVSLEDLTTAGFLQLKQIKNPAFTLIFITRAIMEQGFRLPTPMFNQVTKQVSAIQLKIAGMMKPIPNHQIIRLTAASNYTQFYLSNSTKPLLTSRTLKFYIDKLDRDTFVQPHQSHLVNRRFVKEIVLKPKPCLILKDETYVGIAKRRLPLFKKWKVV